MNKYSRVSDNQDRQLKEIISQLNNINVDEILLRTRIRRVVVSRQLYFYMLHKLFGITTLEIEKVIGYNHATVLHAIRVVNDLKATDSNFRADFNAILERVNVIKKTPEKKVQSRNLNAIIQPRIKNRTKMIHRSMIV